MSAQVNLDFDSEQDMVDKMRLGIALQPIATSLFANSPFRDGKPTGYLSWRSHVWTDTDPDRCGGGPDPTAFAAGFRRVCAGLRIGWEPIYVSVMTLICYEQQWEL